ncbi:Competence protein [Chlamydia serpentis]|uniref:Competence protein n=2 Tax=Chlamydia serpentis TaxID=1967782 RepID=A0A2R8F9X8_9CHLA|nr:Competence protein [Chlamydia serpentis]
MFLCGLYWLAATVCRSHPGCSALILIFLGIFLPRNPKQWVPLAIAWIIPLILTFAPFTHKGLVSGTFVIHRKAWQGIYYGEALSIKSPCGKRARYIACQILSESQLEPKKTYQLQGTLHHTSQIVFKSNACCKEIPKSRLFIIKDACEEASKHFLKNAFYSSEVQAFASSLLLGAPLPKNLQDLFRKKGLSHLFAISGWHFSLCASTLWILFGFFPLKIKNILIFILLTSLTVIFPVSPSVWRAWISTSLLCFSSYFSGCCSGLNRLGLGFMLCSIFFSPFSPSFVLSFLATLGILIFFPILYSFLYTPWTLVLSPFWLRPIRYLASTLAISISAQIFIILPIMHFFGKLPLDGLIYNLIIPFTVLPMIFLLLASLIFPFLVPMTEIFVHKFLANPWLQTPNILTTISFPPVAPWILTLISLVVFFFGVLCSKCSPNPLVPTNTYYLIESL